MDTAIRTRAALMIWAATKRVSVLCMAALMLLAGIASAGAAQVTIVALGTSNTVGRGVPSQESYPTQLQSLLRAKGYDVHVINMGVNGDSTAGILARVNSVPSGTRLVLLEFAAPNEAKHGITNTAANVAEIQSRLAARNIKSIDLSGTFQNEHRAAAASGNLVDTPAGPHLNGVVYGQIAAQVLPQVEAAIGR